MMLSEKNGVAGLHKEVVPFALATHSVCHRLHLAVSKASSGVRGVQLLSQIVTQVYQHVNNSPNRLHKFDELAKLLSMIDGGDGEESTGTAYSFLKFKRVIIFYLTGSTAHDMPH